MKRCFAFVFLLILVLPLAACGKEGQAPASGPSSSQGGGKVISDEGAQSPSSGSAPEQSSRPQTDGPQTNPAEDLLSIATDFALNFPYGFSSPEEVNVDRFCLWKIYYEDPGAVDQDGILWVSPERLAEEVELRFGISGHQFQSPEQENVYPRYVEEKGAIAFMPVGEGGRFSAMLADLEAEGEYQYYTIELYNNMEGPDWRLEHRLRYKFRMVETAGGAPFLQAVSATELSAETSGDPLDMLPTEPGGGAELHEERFFIGGNNAQGTAVAISVPEHWRAINLEKLVSESGCEVRFELVTKAPKDLYDRDAYFKGYEAEYSEIIASGDLGDLGADARYYHFLLEHDDGTKEDKVEYFVFDNGYEAAILLTPVPGKDIQSQREEFEPYLATLKLG